MNKDKQIEEIKKVLIKTCKRVRTAQENYMQDRYAEELYNAGYRKASEVAMEVFEYLEEKGLLNIEVWAIQDVKAELKKKYTEVGE